MGEFEECSLQWCMTYEHTHIAAARVLLALYDGCAWSWVWFACMQPIGGNRESDSLVDRWTIGITVAYEWA
jgi:hypothetical protein